VLSVHSDLEKYLFATFDTVALLVCRDVEVDGAREDTLDFDGFGFFISWSICNILKILKHFLGNIHGFVDAFK